MPVPAPAPAGLSHAESPVPLSRGARTSVLSEQQSTLAGAGAGGPPPLQLQLSSQGQGQSVLLADTAAGSTLTTDRGLATAASGGSGPLVDLVPETDPRALFYRKRAIARCDSFARATRFVQLATQYSAAALTIALRHPHISLVRCDLK